MHLLETLYIREYTDTVTSSELRTPYHKRCAPCACFAHSIIEELNSFYLASWLSKIPWAEHPFVSKESHFKDHQQLQHIHYATHSGLDMLRTWPYTLDTAWQEPDADVSALKVTSLLFGLFRRTCVLSPSAQHNIHLFHLHLSVLVAVRNCKKKRLEMIIRYQASTSADGTR